MKRLLGIFELSKSEQRVVLFERIERISPTSGGSEKAPNLEAISAEMLESANEHFVRAVLNLPEG